MQDSFQADKNSLGLKCLSSSDKNIDLNHEIYEETGYRLA